MPTLDPIQCSFAGGEVSSSIYARTDLDKYKSALRTARNFIVHPQGGVSNRCGFEYIATSRFSTSMCVTQEFIFNQTQAYVLEFGQGYIRFYTDGAQIRVSGAAYSVSTPYQLADLPNLKFEASADVIWITHPNYQTRTLTRYGNSDWELATYAPEDGPFMPDNIDETVSMTVSAVSGTGVTLTVSATLTTDATVVSLLHFDGVDASTTFTDVVGKTWTAVGNAQLDTAQFKFGTASLLLDGTGDYATTPSSADFNFGSADWTIRFWARQNTAGSLQTFLYRHATSNEAFWFYISAGNKLGFSAQGTSVVAGYTTTNTVDLTGSFHEVEITRYATNLYIFVDGVSQPLDVSQAIGTNSLFNATSTLYLGADNGGTTAFNGWIDDLQFIKGRAEHTSNYAVSTAAYVNTEATSGYVFDQGHVGALFKLRHYISGPAVTAAFTSATTSSSIKCFTTWRLITHGTWTGTLKIQKSTDGGTTWTDLRLFSSVNDFNANTSGTEDIETNEVPFLVRLNMSAYTSGTCNADLTSDPFYQEGVVQATAFQSTTKLTVTVLQTVGLTTATIDWAEGSWSTYRGFQTVARFYQDRLAFAATPTEPQTVWFTETGNYQSFVRHQTLLDTDGITVNLPSRQINQINGLVAFKSLLVFTSSAIWSIGPTSGAALTPTTVQQNIEEYNGSANISPVVIGTEAIYNQTGGELIRNIGFQLQVDGFTGSEANILAYHLFQGYTITKMAYQNTPNSIVWCLRSDGVLLALTYNQEQQVVAWTRHDTNGTVESICVIPGDNGDELWASISRTNGRFIERMQGRKQFNLTDHVFMDAYTLVASATSVISSLDWLANQDVSILADNVVLASQTVTAGGSITIPPEDSYLVLQLLMDGTDGSTTITDNEQTPKIMTAAGNAQIDTAQYKFGTGSLLLDGTGDYVTTPDSSDFTFGTGDFTIRGWFRWNSLTGVQVIAGQYVDANNYWKLTKEAASLGTYRIKFKQVIASVTVAEFQSTNVTYSTAQWYYIEFARSGSSAYFFRDGVVLATEIVVAFGTLSDLVSVLYIGQNGNSGEYFNGWIDDFEIFKGIAKHTAAYSVPTAAPSNAVYTNFYIGLPFYSDMETLDVNIPLKTGSMQGSKVKIGNVTFRLVNSRGGNVGPNSGKLYEAFSYADLDRANQLALGTTLGTTANFSGDIRIQLGGEYSMGGRVFLRQSEPLPLSVTDLVPEIDVGGKSS